MNNYFFFRGGTLRLGTLAALVLMTLFTSRSWAQLSSYSFASTVETYTPITGGTVLGTSTSDDQSYVDVAVPAGATGTVTGVGLPIGFNFTFNGSTFDRFGINNNGWIFLGQSALTPAVTNIANSSVPISVANSSTPPQLRSRISAFARDLGGQTGSELRFETIGTSPNRVLVVQFTNYRRLSATGESLNFQIRLHEGTNNVSLHYGTMTLSAGATVEVGLGGNTNADFFNRTTFNTDWAAPAAGTANNSSMGVSATLTPVSGTLYTFAAPTCFIPTALSTDSVTTTTARILWRAPFSAPASSYQYAVTTSSTPPASGTSTNDTIVAISGLTPSTAYNVFVRSNCGGPNGFSNWSGPITFVTGGPISTVSSGLWSNPATWAGGAIPGPGSQVTISTADSVFLDVTTAIASLTVNGVLGVNATAQRVLTVNGATTIVSSGSINFGVPTTGTAPRVLDMKGAFNHAGSSNFASGNAVWGFSGTTAQTINQTGTLTNNAVGQILANNAAGLTLSAPLTVGFNVDLINGAFNIGSNLTFNFTAVAGGSSQVRRSPLGSFVGTPTITSTVHNVQYVFFAGQTSTLITEGPEIPVSRSINALTISNPAGLNLTGNLTVTAATSALVLTNGIINLPAGGKIISTAAFAPTIGSATSFVNGGFEITVNFTTATSRNIPVGSIVNGVPVRGHLVLGALNTSGTSQTITVMPVGTPSGSTVAPLTTVLGQRAFQISATGSIGTSATVALNWDALDAQRFVSTLANIRIAQASSLLGPWTARSASATTGILTGTGTRTSTAISLANGNFFAWGTVGPLDVAVTGLVRPISGECFGQNENVVAVLRNDGPNIDRTTTPITIQGTVTTPGGTIINLTNVVRNSGIFGLGQSDTITFASTVNLVDSGNYTVRIFVDSLTASIRTNDTLTRTVRSDAWTARVNPASIVTTQSANLEILRNGVPAESAGVVAPGQALVRISEMLAFRTGVGAQTIYPSYVSSTAADFLEITNFGDVAANIGGWNLEVFGTGARAYSFPANTVIPVGGVLVLHIGPGTNDSANNYYNTGGTNDAISSTSLWGVTLRNGATLIDAVAFRGFVFPTTAGVTASDWSGNSSTTSSAGMMLVNFDNNTAANWVISTATLFTNLGGFNPSMSFAQRSVSWTGPGNFSASGFNAPTGARNNAGTEQFTATITGANACVRTATASLQVQLPVTPIAGFRVSADTTTIGGIVGTVTLTDTSLNIPFTRRWTITPSTVTFVNGTNDSSIAPQVRFAAVGSYNIKLVVSNPAGVDSVIKNNAVFVRLGYCASNATNTADTKIDSVVIGGLTTGTASTACETYTDNTGLGIAASFVQLQSYNVAIKSGYCGTGSFQARGKIFIDINRNGTFEPSETVGNFGPLTATGTGAAREWFNVAVTVPVTTDTGLTRLRIVWVETTDLNQVQGCGTYAYGETEDFLIRVEKPANYNAVTFRVNMNKYPVSAQGVHIAGEFQGWNPGGSPMQHVGSGIYERTFFLAANDTVEYKFINGNNWGRDEQNWLIGCGLDNGFGSFNRVLAVPAQDVVLPPVFFNSCASTLDQLSVADLQYVPGYMLQDAMREQRSAFKRDTVVVEGVVAAAPGLSALSSSWRGSYLQLEVPMGGTGLWKGWTGVNVRILNLADTVHFVPGNRVRVRGVVAEFPDSAVFSQTQLDIVGSGNVSVLVSGFPVVRHRAFVGELRYSDGQGGFITNMDGEKYEGTYVEMRGLTVVGIAPFGTGRFDITFEDQFGNRIISRDESRVLRAPFFSNTDTTAPLYLAIGDRVNVRGFITSLTSGSIREYRIAPWNGNDIVKTGPIRLEASLRSRSTTSAVIAASHNFEDFFGSMGVVYSTTPNPTLASNNYWDAAASNNLLARLEGALQPGTTYYARAYMQSQNGLQVFYSNEIVVNTFTGPQPQPIVPIFSVRNPAIQRGTRLAGLAFANAGWGFLYDTIAVEAPLVLGRSAINDSLGCDTLVNAAAVNGKIAVLYRGACGFSLKAFAAVRAGAVGLLVINNTPGTINMGSGPEGLGIDIPVMLISNSDGEQLRPFIDNGEAVVLMGNKNGQFSFDLALLRGESVGPDASSITANMAAQLGQYVTPMGAYVLNAGMQTTSQYYLQVTVLKEVAGQNPQQVYNQFQQMAPNTQPGQLGYLSVPAIDWGAPNFGPGNYTIRYMAMPWSGLTDGFLDDNVIERSFSITDSLYAKTRLNANGNLFLDGSGTRLGGVGSWAGANWFEFQGTTNQKVSALRFAFTTNVGQSLVGESIEPQIWEWMDLNNDSLVTTNELMQIGSGSYIYATNAANVQVEAAVQNAITGQPGVTLQPGRKYLFAIQYWGTNLGVFLATDPGVGYIGTNRQTGKRVSAVFNGTDWFSDGFGPQTVFAISAVIGNAALPVTGMVNYDNVANTPMSNTEVMLFQQMSMVKQTTTDAAGMFDFGAVEPGSYTIRANTNKPWGGVNSTDALAIARHFTSAAPLAGLRLEVADVNASETVNATDALQVARRFTNQINSFNLGDWIFKADGFSHTNTQPTMVNVKALAAGDVNASYNPGNNRRMPLVAIEEAGSVRVGSEGTWITAHMVQALELGAVSLELQLPQGVEVQQVKSRLAGGDFTWHVKAGVLYLSWYSLNPVDSRENAPVVDLLVRQTNAVGGSWSAGGESELANGWAEVHGPAQLRLPRLVDGSKGLFAATAYPNPTRDASTLSLNLPATGKVSIRITDALGRVVFENAQEQAVGSHELKLPTERWAAGTYQISVLFEGEITEVQQLRLQVVR